MQKYHTLTCRILQEKKNTVVRFSIKNLICIDNQVGTGARNISLFMRTSLNLIEVFENRMKL